MALVIVIEDGSGVEGANSFATVAQAREYALARGVELAPTGTDGDAAVAVLLVKAMDYLRAKSWAGDAVDWEHSVPFPREGVRPRPELPSYEYPSTSVPKVLVEAQIIIAMEIKKGIDVMPTIVGGSYIVREKIGPLETEYSEKVNAYSTPAIPMVDALLGPWLSYASGFSFRTVRV